MNQYISAIKRVFSTLPKVEQILHGLTVLWVLIQILSSGLMHINHHAIWADISTLSLIHIYSGILLLPICLLFVFIIIKRRTCKDLYPWGFKYFYQLKVDLLILKQCKLPQPSPSGLAATVEGFGLLALLSSLLTGVAWFVAIKAGLDASFFLTIHKTTVGLIETYFYAHGLMGVLHILVETRRYKKSSML
ncbi:cytochrome b/b6 domain-containing protein (plasmid) [Vibrio sp. SS-MA-C1-2]|uniref:cytochrome b/b6 domain-containing protein n=1 Tax=Vibrio sp. SS-MA-C1-2 TaxID=2908646 RepID=UPI001F3BE602|nr:cytochrome b/b6 domain-containing protein [Vibrio sp. SS-MA-C1-2]UJF20259.1 cytochrome b/b6 domain-containing protein [Vibrio sp. SS-MA-C1-2]